MEIVTTIIGEVVGKIIDPIGRQVGYLIHYRTNLETLRDQLKKLEAAKDSLKRRVNEDERKGNRQVNDDVLSWQNDADNMTREAQAIVDDVGQANTKCLHGICPNPIFYHQLSRKSKKLALKIDPHVKREFDNVSHKVTVEEVCAIPSQEYMAFQSRISIVKEIMEEFINRGTNMIGVYGLGGVGKTTLIEEVLRKAKEEKIFEDLVIIPNVKEKSLEKVQKEIAEKLGMDAKESESMEVRAGTLWNRVKDKKTLLIFDDISKIIDLKAVGLLQGPNCKLLLTSRDYNVLHSGMRIDKIFYLELLTELEAWSLFEKMAGDAVKDDRKREVAIEVAKRCGGLPVLIVAVASKLRKRSLEVWKDALRRFKTSDNKELAEKAHSVIEWSYDHLDSKDLKSLFLLCGIIAREDCIISFSDLLKYSMGLGLVKNVRTVEEERNALLSLTIELKFSCLLLDGYDHGSFRMHELIRDEAIRITSSAALSKGCGDEMNCCNIPKLPELPRVSPELKLFILGSDSIDRSLQLPDNYFEGMSGLKALGIVARLEILALPSSLKSLTNLQTLCFHGCALRDIALVGMLTNLKILSLLNSTVRELPKEISQLTYLQLLDLTGCSQLEVIPPNVISSLTRLEDLRMGIRSFKKWNGVIGGTNNACIEELKHLSKLTALEIHVPDANILPAKLFSDELERYTILIGDCWQLPYFYRASSNMLKLKLATSNEVDEGIKYLLNKCENLSLDGVKSASILSCLFDSEQGPNKRLKHLHVQNSDEVRYVMNSSPCSTLNLESLSLENLVHLEAVCCGELVGEPLQKLNSLTLKNLPKFIGFSSKVSTRRDHEIILENEISQPTKLFTNGMVDLMPNITSLILHRCDGLRSLFSRSMATSLGKLKYLEISKCEIMEEIVGANESEEQDTNRNMFCQLKVLRLISLPNLATFCSAGRVEFSTLEELHFRNLPKFIGFMDWMVDLMPNITSLILHRCDGLRSLFSRSMATSLGKLKYLEISECEIMEEIVGANESEEQDTNRNMFCQLKVLWLISLPNLATFCSAGRVEFSTLEELHFRNLPKFIGFMDGMVDLMPNITSLILHRCDGLRSLFSRSMATSLGKLKHLEISECEIMEEIIGANESEEQDTNRNMFCQLKVLRLISLPNLATFCSAGRVEFSTLEELHLKDCSKLGTFITDPKSAINMIGKGKEGRDSEVNVQPDVPCFLFDEKVALPSLEKLSIFGQPKLMTIWDNQLAPHYWGRLKDIIIVQCDSLLYIFPVSIAKSIQQLTRLNVEKCKMLEEIVAKEDGDETRHEFMFPEATKVSFWELPKLRRFYPGQHVSKWPLLKYLRFQECENVEILFSRFQEKVVDTPISKQPFFFIEKGSFSNLETLSLDNLETLTLGENTEIWYEAYGPLAADLFSKLKRIIFCGAHPNISLSVLQKLHNLEELVVFDGPATWNEIFVYPPSPPPQGNGNGSGNSNSSRGGDICAVRSGSLPHVKKLILWSMRELLHLGNDYNSQPVFPNLEILQVWFCDRLQNLTSSAISFLNLTTLDVYGCDGLKYLLTYSVARSLKKLKKLEVGDCKSIVEIIAASNGDDVDDSDSDIAFSCLQHLDLWNLPSLRGFCSEKYVVRVPCLNTNLDVRGCPIEFRISPDRLLLVEENQEAVPV